MNIAHASNEHQIWNEHQPHFREQVTFCFEDKKTSNQNEHHKYWANIRSNWIEYHKCFQRTLHMLLGNIEPQVLVVNSQLVNIIDEYTNIRFRPNEQQNQ